VSHALIRTAIYISLKRKPVIDIMAGVESLEGSRPAINDFEDRFIVSP
jgi:hypothetical protein